MTTKDVPRDQSQELVAIGPGLKVLSPMWITETLEGVDVWAEITFDRKLRRGVVSDFRATRRRNGPPITGELLRRIPIRDLVVNMMRNVVVEMNGQQLLNASTRLPDEDELHFVARIYRTAQACAYNPTQAVREALGVAMSTATAKVGRCRERGLLPQTEPGKVKI